MVIEFQKRGLPHARILVILDEHTKPRNSDDFNQISCAEIPDKELYSSLYETVTKSMIHGPFGIFNPKSPCMVDGKCSKQFPKAFIENTTPNIDGYPEYRRRDNVVTHELKRSKLASKNGTNQQSEEQYSLTFVDNRWIVPYNKYLTTKYNCHINVEIFSSVSFEIRRFKHR